MDLARAQGLLVGCAPDTFLGGGIQTCRKLLDDGAIGELHGVFRTAHNFAQHSEEKDANTHGSNSSLA